MGSKRQYRIIDFKRDKPGVPGKIVSIEYDPNRTARIALIHYRDGEKRYILAPIGLEVGATVESGPDADIKPGNNLPLRNIPTGTQVHNVELTPGRGGQLVRGAGTSAPSAGARRRSCTGAPAFRRNAPHAGDVPSDCGTGKQY